MAINLQKGQKIDLTKSRAGLTSLTIGLGWDPVKQKKGFFGRFSNKSNIDCDASVLMLDEHDKLASTKDVIYFGHLKSKCRSVVHTGDNLTGEGDGDDEQVLVYLNKVPARIHKLLFVVNIYHCVQRKQDFGMIENAFIRVVDASNHTELIHYNLTENYAGLTALYPGELYRHNGEWKFTAIGQGTKDTSIDQIVQHYL